MSLAAFLACGSAILLSGVRGGDFAARLHRDDLRRRWESELAARPEFGPGSRSEVLSRAARADLLDPATVSGYRRLGLGHPTADLRFDLMCHPELIPFQGDHSPMGFFAPEEIRILPGGLALAYFEDGMTSGHCSLSYAVLPCGLVHWRLIEASLD